MPFIDCAQVASDILSFDRLSFQCNDNKAALAVIWTENDPASRSYIKRIRAQSRLAHIELEELIIHSDTNDFTMHKFIKDCNEDSSIHGILISAPTCLGLQQFNKKNIEGEIHHHLEHKVSCAARACIDILDSYIKIGLKKCLVIGYGKVGVPVSYLLMRHHASSVILTHEYTELEKIFDYIEESDIIISAVGKAHFIPYSHRYRDKVFIDVGVDMTENGIKGDIDPKLAENNMLTPVPGGVGPVTSALLLENVKLASLEI